MRDKFFNFVFISSYASYYYYNIFMLLLYTDVMYFVSKYRKSGEKIP